jgi:hypothetical protein
MEVLKAEASPHATKEYIEKVSKFKSFTAELDKTYPYDEKNPRALLNMLSPALKRYYENYEVQMYLAKGEQELERILQPDVTVKRIRISLWHWYSTLHDKMQWRSCDPSDRLISHERICLGVCNPVIWDKNIRDNSLALAYIFTCPVSYEIMVQEALSESMNRLREILAFPLYEERFTRNGEVILKNGVPAVRPNLKAAEIMLKVAAFLDLRVNGAIPKLIQQDVRSINLHQHNAAAAAANTNIVNHQDLGNTLMSIEDIDSQIDNLRKQTEALIRYPSFTKLESENILVDTHGHSRD